MLIVTMMYPADGTAHFDFDYYMNHHMPLVRSRWNPLGMESDQVLRGVPAPDGTPPVYRLMTIMTFTSMDSFNDSVAQHGEELYGDVANFTAITPVRMFGEAAPG